MLQQGTEKSLFRVIFRIDFDITTTMILKIPFPDSTYFELKVLIVECATLENYENKSVEWRSKEHRIEFSELSFELALALGQQ